MVSLSGGSPLGIIASIEGNVLTLEGMTLVAIPANDAVTYRDGVDPTPRSEAADAGATTITMNDVSGVAISNFVFLYDGTELGKIAFVDGNVLILEAALSAAIPIGSPLTFVEDNTGFPIVGDGNVLNISTRGILVSGDGGLAIFEVFEVNEQ
ncbi:MAG: hypothetical protein CMI18_10990 [Opitutaceae bacterium]|nr:hypothetical protein [Opitutaceae bacterium]